MSVKITIQHNTNKKATDMLNNLIKGHLGVKVGFYENNPNIHKAIANEFGGEITVPEHETTVYRKIKDSGEFAKNGRFVKKEESNFATTHTVKEYTINVPPRPFMHQTIQNHKKEWTPIFNKLLKKNGGNVDKAFNSLGAVIKGQVVDTIINGEFEPNAPSTIAKKGFDKPLIETSDMKNSVSWAVIEGNK